MGLDITANLAVREKNGPPRAAKSLTCSRCGATNPFTSSRCRSCYTPLPSKAAALPSAAPSVPRTNTIEARRPDVEAIFGELEALTHEERAPAIQFQCPECGRFVDQDSARCQCGALFEDPGDIVGYECPLCGVRVRGDAKACSCGARFSD